MKLHAINVLIIPQHEQRYETWGDYWWSAPGVLEVRISFRKNWLVSFGILLHELYELGLVLHRGIPFDQIDEFDKAYKGSDPGAHPSAPYHVEHMAALEVEEMWYSAVEHADGCGP